MNTSPLTTDPVLDDRNVEKGWITLYDLLSPLTKRWVYAARIPSRSGQENDIAWDIVQVTIQRTYEYYLKARCENIPVGSFQQLSIRIAKNYFQDFRRRDSQFQPFNRDGYSQVENTIYDELNIAGAVLDNIYEEWLFQKIAKEIASFPTKLRTAMLIDIARRGEFDILLLFPLKLWRYHLHEFEVVRRLARLAQFADAFVWGTLVYHNSFSGILKNALDHLNTQQFRNKPVALISNGGMHCTAEPCDQLRIIAHGLLAIALPTQVVTVDSDFEFFQGRFIIVNPLINESLARLAEELLIYSIFMRQLRILADRSVFWKQPVHYCMMAFIFICTFAGSFKGDLRWANGQLDK